MEESLLICVSSPSDIDEVLIMAWTQGLNEEEAWQMKAKENVFMGFSFRNQHRKSNDKKMVEELMRKDVLDQYRCFAFLEHYFQNPLLLQQQALIEMKPSTQQLCVSCYWSLDDLFVKEILMAKRPIKSRKDLDDIAEATGLSLRRVTRQFDNLKRLYASIEESKNSWQCNVATYLETQYVLSVQLATQYACILFLQVSKFSLASKKRLQRARCESLELCAALILSCLNTEQDLFFAVNLSDAEQLPFSSGAGIQSPFNSKPPPAPSFSSSIPAIAPFISSPSSGVGLPYIPSIVNSSQQYTNLMPSGPQVTRARESSTIDYGSVVDDSFLLPTDELLLPGYEDLCWKRVWGLFHRVESIDIDKHLLASLREIRNILTGDALDLACNQVRQMLSSALFNGNTAHSAATSISSAASGGLSSSPPNVTTLQASPSTKGFGNTTADGLLQEISLSNRAAIKKLLEGQRVRAVLKALIQIGANLSQSREYRDLFEDLLTKVAEPLEEVGITGGDMQIFLVFCMYAMKTVSFPNRANRSHSNASTGQASQSGQAIGAGVSQTSSGVDNSSRVSRVGTITDSMSRISGPGIGSASSFNAETSTKSSRSTLSDSIGNSAAITGGGTPIAMSSSTPQSPQGQRSTQPFASTNVAGNESGINSLTTLGSVGGSEKSSFSSIIADGSNFSSVQRNVHRSSSSVSSVMGTEVGLSASGSAASASNRGDVLRKDWIRFITCCRLCLHQLTR